MGRAWPDGTAIQTRHEGQGVETVLAAGGEDAAESLLSAGTGPSSVAAEDLAIHHRGAHGLLRWPVGGLDVRRIKECENLISVPDQVRLRPSVGLVRRFASQ